MSGDYDYLDSFEGDWRPEQGIRPGVEALADGGYDFTILSASLERANDGSNLLRVSLRTGDGMEIDRPYWLTKQQSANRLCADLCLLGFDADKWSAANRRPLRDELPRAVAKLPGSRFRATKSSRKDKEGKVWHDLYISGKLPSAPGAAPTSAPPPGYKPGSSIPF